jgi:hypothetical protein
MGRRATPHQNHQFYPIQPVMSQPTHTQLASKEGRMALAINSYKSGDFTSIREAAVTYDIPRSTLQARLHGRVSQQEIRSTNLKLTDMEELTLIN